MKALFIAGSSLYGPVNPLHTQPTLPFLSIKSQASCQQSIVQVH